MNRRPLGCSDLLVSEVALGSWLTYEGGVQRDEVVACTRAAFDAGINFFDTANVYGAGAAERAWGEILAGYPRDSYVLATKVYFPMSATDRGLSAAQIHRQIDGSLQRLRTDYVDLYQCHRYDDDTLLAETMQALTEVVRSGKARYIGFSEWTAPQIQAAIEMAGVERFVSSQPRYSMLERRPEHDVIALCAANGISQIAFSPLAQGVLTGKYRPGEPPPPDSRAASATMGAFIGRYLDEPTLLAVGRLAPIARAVGLTMAQLALAWVLREPDVASAIIGASRPQQIHHNALAAGVTLEQETLDAIDRALAGVIRR